MAEPSKRPLVTIGIPNYNYGGYLRQCVESVLAQDYQELEVLVSDNASTDDSMAVLQTIRDPRLRYWSNERNVGIFPNWDKLVRAARGEYFKILPADDYLEPTFVSCCVQAMEQRSCDVAFTGFKAFGLQNWEATPSVYGFVGPVVVGELQDIVRTVKDVSVLVQPTASLYRSSLVPEGYGGDSGSRGIDMSYWAKAITRGRTVFINEVLAAVRFHPGQEHRVRDMSRSLGDMLDALELLRPHDPGSYVEDFARGIARTFGRNLWASLARGHWGIAWRNGRQLVRHGRLVAALGDAFRPRKV